MLTRWKTATLGLWLLTTPLIPATGADQGEEPTSKPAEIRLGMSTVLTGPAAALGLEMRLGVLAAFDEFNRAGGHHGTPLRLIALDDGYEPARAAPNMRRLIDEEQVLAVIGNVGTPTAVASTPIANASRTLLFGPFTGAGVLRRTPPDRYIINYRASYAEETAAMVDALLDHAGLRPEEIGFFTQRDAYGDAGYVGGLKALKRRGLSEGHAVVHGRYERNTDIVESALADVLLADPPVRAVIMVGAYEPCAKFIKLARENEYNPLFLNVSFVGSAALAAALGGQGDGVIITQVVPHFAADRSIAREYRAALKAVDEKAEPTFGSLEGYVAGRVFCRALVTVPEGPTREGVVDALEALGDFDLGLGAPLSLSPDDHQACHSVWPTVIRGGQIVSMDWVELGHGRTGGRP